MLGTAKNGPHKKSQPAVHPRATAQNGNETATGQGKATVRGMMDGS